MQWCDSVIVLYFWIHLSVKQQAAAPHLVRHLCPAKLGLKQVSSVNCILLWSLFVVLFYSVLLFWEVIQLLMIFQKAVVYILWWQPCHQLMAFLTKPHLICCLGSWAVLGPLLTASSDVFVTTLILVIFCINFLY